MKLFHLMLVAVILVGGLVAGVVGLLLPKISTGLELGMLTSLFLGTIIYGVFDISVFGQVSVSTMFIGSISAAVLGTQRFEDFCAMSRTALVTGLLLALSVDALVGGGLLVLVSYVLRIATPDRQSLCLQDCHVGLLLCVWLFVAALSMALQAHYSGLVQFCGWGNRPGGAYSYASVGITDDTPRQPPAKQIEQRTTDYPDTLEFNFFDPDNLPSVLEPYAKDIIESVQRLMKLHGFQVDSTRNQAEHLLMLLSNETRQEDQALPEPCLRLHDKVSAVRCVLCVVCCVCSSPNPPTSSHL